MSRMVRVGCVVDIEDSEGWRESFDEGNERGEGEIVAFDEGEAGEGRVRVLGLVEDETDEFVIDEIGGSRNVESFEFVQGE